VTDALKAAGIEEEHGAAACDHADAEAVSAALRFAQRRRVGPFADSAPRDHRDKEKALAAMIRAGHGFDLSRAILAMPPGSDVDPDQLSR
jgi:regulatory protein